MANVVRLQLLVNMAPVENAILTVWPVKIRPKNGISLVVAQFGLMILIVSKIPMVLLPVMWTIEPESVMVALGAFPIP